MLNSGRKRILCVFLLVCVLGGGLTVQGTPPQQSSESLQPFSSDSIIHQGLSEVKNMQLGASSQDQQLAILETWFNTNPYVTYASRIENSITVKFIDDSYTVLMDPSISEIHSLPRPSETRNYKEYGMVNGSSAVLLNPEEYTYGHRQCQQIIIALLKHDYHINYLANDAVSLSYLRRNLSADIVYMNTHAGFFDTDGDHQADAVVIATGESWTNTTEQTYSFEYQHHMIVKGMIGEKSIIAFTPAFIEFYYPPGTLPNSLIYMATCFSSYDASMANAFLDAGASAYLGWSRDTVFWINSKTSVHSFRLFTNGWTVQEICRIVGFGGIMNRLFHSKLLFYGDGQHRIPQ
jgi:hypothetical protein